MKIYCVVRGGSICRRKGPSKPTPPPGGPRACAVRLAARARAWFARALERVVPARVLRARVRVCRVRSLPATARASASLVSARYRQLLPFCLAHVPDRYRDSTLPRCPASLMRTRHSPALCPALSVGYAIIPPISATSKPGLSVDICARQ